jgi:Flp pilus assembly protein TadG
MDNDTGSATAETAVALPALVVALLLCVWALSVVSATLRCADAARAAARTAARHESPDAVAAAARRAAGRPVTVTLTPAGDLVTVRVALRVAPSAGLLARLVPPVTVRQSSTAHVEPGAGDP